MSFKEFKYLVASDVYRVAGKFGWRILLKNILLGGSFKYVFWMRTWKFTKSNIFLRFTIHPISMFMLNRMTYKFGISIPPMTQIGSGFYIGHFGGIVVNERSVIGRNCNISHGVTLGQANRGKRKGCPTLGDNVYIGPGAKIVGAVVVGNNVAIGANCVVVNDIPDNSVVVGIPGKVVSQNGSNGYINRTDYDEAFRGSIQRTRERF